MLYLHAFLSRSRLCHALCLLWACAYRSLGPPACVVASVPLVAYLGVTTYEIHLCGVGLLDAYPFYTSFDVMLALLALCHLFGYLWIFARLPTCSCMGLCVVHTPNSWNYGHPKPTFVFLGRPPLFDNLFICPRLAPFDSLSFSMLSFYLFPLSLHVHAWSMDTWSKGATS